MQPTTVSRGWAAVPQTPHYPRYQSRPRVVVVPAVPPQGPAHGEAYTDPRGRYCREYQTTASIGGRQERLYGRACLMPDGSWQFEG